jgi:hypothetical protein
MNSSSEDAEATRNFEPNAPEGSSLNSRGAVRAMSCSLILFTRQSSLAALQVNVQLQKIISQTYPSFVNKFPSLLAGGLFA